MEMDRDYAAEVRIRAGAGLLCCRDMIQRTYVLRFAPAVEEAYEPIFSTVESQLAKLPTKFTEHNVLDGQTYIAEDWLDLQVPHGGLIWNDGQSAGENQVDERLGQILYLKFFRLSTLGVSRFALETNEVALEWQLFQTLLQDMTAYCIRRQVREAQGVRVFRFCNFVQSTFVVLELISARMTCIGGCLPQTFSSCANEDVLAEASNQIVEVLVQATFQEFLSQFHIVNQIASIARCGLDSDMPPVEVVYSTDFSQVERLTFSQSVWGKYMFRIQSLAGTVS
jgi:hypothetical protein